jgi:hypothetical protein
VVIYLVTSALVLGAGVTIGGTAGLYIGVAGLTASVFTQTAWLWLRSRPVMAVLHLRDQWQAPLAASPSSADQGI